MQIAEIGLGDRRAPLGFDREKRRRMNIVMPVKRALAGADRVCFRAGRRAQNAQRQSESKTPDGVNLPPAVERFSMCCNHPPAFPVATAGQDARLGDSAGGGNENLTLVSPGDGREGRSLPSPGRTE